MAKILFLRLYLVYLFFRVLSIKNKKLFKKEKGESMPTPHNQAKENEIAPIVLMAGDPLRVKMIAEKYLENKKLVNKVRSCFAYTGTYKGKRISIMAHGMGNPSMGIYSYELFHQYHVDTIIRVGSIGSLNKKVKVRDIIVANNCYTTTNYMNIYMNKGACFLEGDKALLKLAKHLKKNVESPVHFGSIYCSDTFYTDNDDIALAKDKNLLGVEMESAALYFNAEKFGKHALTICTVSDSLITNEVLSSDDRQKGFFDMIDYAFDIIMNL